MANQVFILGGARTPMTTHVGALKDLSAIELGALASKAALERTATRPECSRAVWMRITARATWA